MAVALTFTDADAVVTDLNDLVAFGLEDVRGAGIPGLRHDTVKTPSRDGETYVRTILEPRFLIVQLAVFGTTWAAHLANRRTLVTALNPKTGVGTLQYTPDATAYAIDCLVERGVGFSKSLGAFTERATISFRCPDPAWFDPAEASILAAITGGLSIPMTIPMSIGALTETKVIANAGDLDVFPTITVPGVPFTNPTITNVTTSKKLALTGITVNIGETLTIDMEAKTVKVGSTSVIDKMTSASEFWSLAKGNNTVKFETSSGFGSFTLTYNTKFLGV